MFTPTLSRAIATALDDLPVDLHQWELRNAAATEDLQPESSVEALPPELQAMLQTPPDAAVSDEIVASVSQDRLGVFATPNQARAPQGTPIGGQWIDTPNALLHGLGWADESPDTPDQVYTVPETNPPGWDPWQFQSGMDSHMPTAEDYAPEQVVAIGEYTGQQNVPMNTWLREGRLNPAYPGSTPERVQADIAAFDTAFTPIPGDTPVYRGLGNALDTDNLDGLVGSVIADKGYMSTSLNPWATTPFGGGIGSDKPILKVTVPKGTPVVWPGKMATVSGEMEVVLPHGLPLAVTGWYWDEKMKRNVVQATVANPSLQGSVPLFDIDEGEGEHQTWETYEERGRRLAANLGLTAAAPNQARAPKGTPIGGQWIDTPGGVLGDLAPKEGEGYHASPEFTAALDVIRGYRALPRYDERTAAEKAVDDALDLPKMYDGGDREATKAQMQDALDQWKTTAPEDLRIGVRNYTQGDYWTINARLRGQTEMRKHGTVDEMVPIDPVQTAYLDSSVDALRNQFAGNGFRTGNQVTAAYRGFDTRYAAGDWPIGAFKRDGGITSASMSVLTTTGFGESFLVLVPPNTDYLLGNSDEQEVMFAPGSVWERVDEHTMRVHPPNTPVTAAALTAAAIQDLPTGGEVGDNSERFTGFPVDMEDVDPPALTAAAPAQARAPKGTPIGGEWIETPGALAAGIGARDRLLLGYVNDRELSDARGKALAKADALPEPTDADRAAAEARHGKSKRQGGDDRPGSVRRRKLRQDLLTEFGDGTTCPCLNCGRRLDITTVSMDRIIPGSDNGRYVPKNLIPMDYDCNRVRSNSDFDEMADSWSITAAAPPNPNEMGDEPAFTPGTLVRGTPSGWGRDESGDLDGADDAPSLEGVPEFVEGPLETVPVEGYLKHIVDGYDVDPATLEETS